MDNGANESQMITRVVLGGSVFILKTAGKGGIDIARFIASAASGENQLSGEINLKTLLKSGEQLKVFSIRGRDNFINFAKGAKEYGVLYSVIKGEDKENSDIFEVMVKAKDAAKINRVIEKYALVSLDASPDVEVTEENASRMDLGDIREVVSKMLEQDVVSGKDGKDLNPGQLPEREALSGGGSGYITKTPNAPLSERGSVKEEIRSIKADNVSDSSTLIANMLLPDDEDEKAMEQFDETARFLMEKMKEMGKDTELIRR